MGASFRAVRPTRADPQLSTNWRALTWIKGRTKFPSTSRHLVDRVAPSRVCSSHGTLATTRRSPTRAADFVTVEALSTRHPRGVEMLPNLHSAKFDTGNKLLLAAACQ
jgi:hypothetical protein